MVRQEWEREGYDFAREIGRSRDGIERMESRILWDLILNPDSKGFDGTEILGGLKEIFFQGDQRQSLQIKIEKIQAFKGMIFYNLFWKELKIMEWGILWMLTGLQFLTKYVVYFMDLIGFYGLIWRIKNNLWAYSSHCDLIRKIFDCQWTFLCGRRHRDERNYKRGGEVSIYFITFIQNNITTHNFLSFQRFEIFIIMTQGQLLTIVGNKIGGDVAPKPLRITVPHFDNTALIQGYAKTLIDKCMNPSEQDVKALIIMMPKIWKVEDKVVGTDLGLGRFQFDFDNEEDIEEVLRMQPYHFDYWMISLVRWKPVAERNFPTEITFWVRVLDVPLQFWAEPTFESIGGALGTVVEVDSDYGRVKVIIDGSKCLCFETTVNFRGGEFHDGGEESISLRYEKLFGYCKRCFSLCHEMSKCSLFKKGSDKELELREAKDGKYGERAASYKGVTINGSAVRKEQEEEGNEHQGKGKGKMYEEDDAKWVRVEGRGNRKPSLDRSRFRRDEREARSFHPRYQEGHYRATGFRGTRRERSPRDSYQYQERSKGRTYEATRAAQSAESGVLKQDQISQEEGQVIRLPVKELGSKQIMTEKEDIEDGMDVINETVLNRDNLVNVDDMETDGVYIKSNMDIESKVEETGFQDLTDEEYAGKQGEDEVNKGLGIEKNEEMEEIAKEGNGEDVEKNKGHKKKAIKNVPLLGGTTKQRMMQIATKRPTSKVNTKGTGVKQGAEQGSSNPTPSIGKP